MLHANSCTVLVDSVVHHYRCWWTFEFNSNFFTVLHKYFHRGILHATHLTSHFEVVEFVFYHRHVFLEGGLEDEAEDAVGAVRNLMEIMKKPEDRTEALTLMS